MRNRALAFICATLVLFIAFDLSAQDGSSELDRRSYELYQQVFSPFCPGRSLNDCPSSKAQELKLEMRAKLENGVPPEAILDEVFSRFGEKFRAVPRYAGFGKLVWWVPVGFLLVGALAVCIVAKAGSRGVGRVDTQDSIDTLSDEVKARIQRELASLDD